MEHEVLVNFVVQPLVLSAEVLEGRSVVVNESKIFFQKQDNMPKVRSGDSPSQEIISL